MAALQPGHCRMRAWQGERAIVRPFAIRANMMHTKRSRERAARAGESNGVSLYNATSDTSHFVRAMSA